MQKAVTNVKDQFATATKHLFTSERISGCNYSLRMNFQIEISAAQTVEEYMIKCADRKVSGKDIEIDRKLSFVATVQSFRSKSKVFWRAGAP